MTDVAAVDLRSMSGWYLPGLSPTAWRKAEINIRISPRNVSIFMINVSRLHTNSETFVYSVPDDAQHSKTRLHVMTRQDDHATYTMLHAL